MSIEKEYIRQINENAMFEMTNIEQQDTGLTVMVYVSPKNAGHGPRIKFMNGHGSSYNADLAIPMTIEDSPRIPVKFTQKIKDKEVQLVRDWVVLNKDILLDYWNKKITTKQMINSIRSLK